MSRKDDIVKSTNVQMLCCTVECKRNLKWLSGYKVIFPSHVGFAPYTYLFDIKWRFSL